MRNKLYPRNPTPVRYGTRYVSKNLVFDTTKYKRLWLLTMLQEKKNYKKLPMSLRQNIFATCWF